MKSIIGGMLAATLLAGAAPSNKHWHEDDRHWQKHAKHHDDDDDRAFDHRAGACYFVPGDVRVITEYYAPRSRALPPGLQKKLYRTGRLPPGWEKKMQPLPVIVERQLVELPPDYRRGFLDGYAVVYNPHTQVVVDFVAVFGR